MNYKIHLVTIDEEKGKSQKVADYLFLKDFCLENSIEVYVSNKYSLISEEDLTFFKNQKFDIGFVVGWQRLVPEKILNTFSVGVFGMHGSPMNLPKGRGRSPMNWSIIEGRKIFYTNLFKYDSGADDGDVLDTFKFQVTDSDTGETMHFKNTLAMKYLIQKNIDNLVNQNFTLTKQPNTIPTYYPKRTESDSIIDWGDDIFNIERLIRAVTKPFNGAYSFIKNNKVIIYRAAIFDFQDFGYENIMPGQILEVFDNDKFLVKAYGGLLLVHEFHSEIEIDSGAMFSNNNIDSVFEHNKYGFHDLE
ncbi:methionyl-tRNA formyltransferase [Allomuricauda sp. R78024]|uniref:methionyl-tRNA formyltransferase n=1 Tax=Allomuricauda sp. R78024 TaxID=3093867 RepID=UPI0037CC1B06